MGEGTNAATGTVDRRQFGRSLAGVAAAVAGMGGVGLKAAGASTALSPNRARGQGKKSKPNVLCILADDLGYGDLGVYGSHDIKTPNLDRLAADGMRFTDGYSSAPTCSPTRFGLYTGRYPGRLFGGLIEPLGAPAGSKPDEGLPPEHPTLASLLKAAGYETAMYGKWHCGYLPNFSPTKSGWEEFFGNFGGGVDYYFRTPGATAQNTDLYEDEVPANEAGYYTDLLTERASDFIRRKHDSPWLLNLNYTSPHFPWETNDKAGEALARVTTDRREKIGGGPDSGGILAGYDAGSRAIYVKMVEDLDRAVGATLRALERAGEADNTIVVFTSDNGGERFSDNGPFRGAKDELLEGGIRVPLMVRWPGQVPKKSVSKDPVSTVDLTATLLEAGGTQPDAAYAPDGTSLVGLLTNGKKLPERDLFWRIQAEGALRRGRYKFFRGTYTGLPGQHDPNVYEQLYDLKADPLEHADLAVLKPEIVNELRSAWETTAAGLLPYRAPPGAPLPIRPKG